MLEGKELEGKIGSIGEYSADIDDKGVVTVSVGVKVDLFAELEKLVVKTGSKWDDQALAFIKALLGR